MTTGDKLSILDLTQRYGDCCIKAIGFDMVKNHSDSERQRKRMSQILETQKDIMNKYDELIDGVMK